MTGCELQFRLRSSKKMAIASLHHGLGLLEPPCLRVDAPQLGNTDRPPVTAALTLSGVGLTLHRFHHPRPNSASRVVKMPWAGDLVDLAVPRDCDLGSAAPPDLPPRHQPSPGGKSLGSHGASPLVPRHAEFYPLATAWQQIGRHQPLRWASVRGDGSAPDRNRTCCLSVRSQTS